MSDDGTTVLLDGRSGGQTISGGTGGGENLTLKSTSAETPGKVFVADTLAPTTSGTDLGTSYYKFGNVYLNGELKGGRFESFTTANRPAASAETIGRVIWDTTLEKAFVDAGGIWVSKDVDRYVCEDSDNWDGSTTEVTYTVDGSVDPENGRVSDARRCIWTLREEAESYRQINCEIYLTQTTVIVVVDDPLTAGTYTLIGIG